MDEWTVLESNPGSAGYLPVEHRRYALPDGTEAVWDIFGGPASVAILAVTADAQVDLAGEGPPSSNAIYVIRCGGVEIHRSARRHGVSDADILHAAEHPLVVVDVEPDADPPKVLVIGPDLSSNLLRALRS